MKVCFQNGNRAFSEIAPSTETAPAIVDTALGGVDGNPDRRPDVVGVVEAGPAFGGGIEVSPAGGMEIARLTDGGFKVWTPAYSEYEHPDGKLRGDRHGMLIAVRREVSAGEPKPIGLDGGRLAFAVPIWNAETEEVEEVDIAHFNDRPERNLWDARALLGHVATVQAAGGRVRGIMLDANSANPESIQRTVPYYLVHALAAAVRHGLPAEPPESHRPSPWRPSRWGDIGRRADAMLEGESYKAFVEAGWHSADPNHTPTKSGFMQIDYVFTQGGPEAVRDFALVRAPGADHAGPYAELA